MAEIFSVLQSVGVVQQQEKEKFRWLGSSSIMSALTKLSKVLVISQSKCFEVYVSVHSNIIVLL